MDTAVKRSEGRMGRWVYQAVSGASGWRICEENHGTYGTLDFFETVKGRTSDAHLSIGRKAHGTVSGRLCAGAHHREKLR